MDSNNTQKEKFLYLDFNEKLSRDILKNKVFIRIVNLEDKNPLVQINDLIFKGTYSYSLGTNLFFEKSSNEGPVDFPFKEPPKFNLKFIKTQTKVLNCTQMKVPSIAMTTAPLPATQLKQDNFKFNFQWDYKELLKKFEKGTLDLQDMITLKNHNEIENNSTNLEVNKINIELQPMETEDVNNLEISEIQHMGDPEPMKEPELQDNLKIAYESLQLLARTPVKRQVKVEQCHCDPKFQKEYDYRSIECKILEPPLFSYIKKQTTLQNNYECHINLDRCIKLGLLKPLDRFSRILSKAEQCQVLRVDNFENLDLTARYSVLYAHMIELEKQVNSNSSKNNVKKDEFDRTPVETLEIFKKLVKSLSRQIKLND